MAKLRELSNRMLKLQESMSSLEAANYRCERDEDSNLHLIFEDGFETKLPYVNFRPYQLALQRKIFIDGCKRVLVQRPRRSGKEVESWNLLLQGSMMTPGLYLMVYPTNVRARKILWEGAAFVDGKSIPFLKMLPKRLIQSVNNSDMTLKLKNGSVIWIVGSDIDPDKLRGTNPLGIVFAEFAFQDPRVLYTMLPVLRQNGGWLICQSTFDGMNHFYQMMKQNAYDPLWYCQSDSIESLVDENGDRYITDEMIDEDRRAGMPEYLIQQEYYGKVQVNQETKYFAEAINYILENDKLVDGLVMPNQNLYTAWDLGVNDMNCIVFFQIQIKEGALWPAVVGYMENNNKDLVFYIDECRRFANRYNLSIRTHFLPHDGKAATRVTIGNETTQMQMQKLGEKVMIVARPNDKRVAIESMRRKLHMTSFNKENTQRLIDCLSNYSKEYDDKLGTYRNKPLHNWASHGCFTGDTLVLTRSGQVPIISLPKTGEVLTSCGWKPYINPRVTRKNAQLVEVVFKNGYTVRCTPDHLFLTESGWKSAESLQRNTMIQSSLTQLHNTLMEDFIGFGHKSLIIPAAVKNYIVLLGKQPLVKYLKNVIYITRMEIKRIMPYLIWNVWMPQSTLDLPGRKQNILDQMLSKKQIMIKPQHGIDHQKEGYGIVGMQSSPKVGKFGKESLKLVLFVKKKLKCLLEKVKTRKNIAHQNADLCIDHIKKISHYEDVWCLTVPSIGEFSLGNGAIVHNCDSYQTMTLALDNGMIFESPTEIIYYTN